jgi:hypothetical protein
MPLKCEKISFDFSEKLKRDDRNDFIYIYIYRHTHVNKEKLLILSTRFTKGKVED